MEPVFRRRIWKYRIKFIPFSFAFSYRRAALYEETDKLDECMADYTKIVELEPNHVEAKTHIIRLQPIIAERNERLKDEMMGKLKDLGNMILKPFGLSTSNFQLQQDPNTGSYSVNFNQAPPRP